MGSTRSILNVKTSIRVNLNLSPRWRLFLKKWRLIIPGLLVGLGLLEKINLLKSYIISASKCWGSYRLLLEVSQTPYDSIMYFGKGEYKEFAPFGQLPVYKGPELGGVLLAQSDAVCYHIARETGLAGATAKEK